MNLSIKQNYPNITFIGIALFCAYLLFPTGFEYFLTPYKSDVPMWEPLDSSWMLALNYAKINDLRWGIDFMFTYGPLSQLSTRIGWGESRYLFLSFDLFMLLNWFSVIYLSLKQSQNKVLTGILVTMLTLFLPIWIGGKISIYLLLFLVFWIRQGMEHKKIVSYVMQIIIITLCFFIKFNSTLFTFFLFYIVLFYMFYKKDLNYKKFLIYAITPIVLIYALSLFFNVSIPDYMIGGFELISGYNEIMYEDYPLPDTHIFLNIVAIIVITVIVFNFLNNKNEDLIKRFLIVILAAVPFFVMYKQGFTRSNVGYNEHFFTFVILYFITISDFHFWLNKKLQIAVCIGVLTAVSFLYIKSELPIEIYNKIEKSAYIDGFQNFTPDSHLVLKEQSPKFPDAILQIINTKTVDAYPFNLRMLFENDLNYLPRPCLQSYSAYTPFLEEINFSLYNNPEKAPEFVVYEYGALDNRYPLFDESKVNIALQLNYEVVEMFDYDKKKLLLLRKKRDFKPVSFIKTKEYAMMLNSPLAPKKGIYYQIELYNNIVGDVYGIFKHAPDLKLEIQIKEDARLVFKTSKKLLKTGIYDANVIENTQDFSDIVMTGSSKKSVRFYNFRPMNESMFKDKIKITEYKITQ